MEKLKKTTVNTCQQLIIIENKHERKLLPMRTLIITTLILNFQLLFAQNGTDTIYFNKHKYPLKQSNTKYNYHYTGDICLPTEYGNEINEKEIAYKYFNPRVTDFEVYDDLPGRSISGHDIDTNLLRNWDNEKKFTFNNILDTITVKGGYEISKTYFNTEIETYIISNNVKYYLCGLTLYRISNDTITESLIRGESKIDSFHFEFNYYREEPHEKTKKGMYVATAMYYRKGKATYYLDRTLVIKVE